MSDIIRASLDGIRDFADINTSVGTPIQTESGVTVIPISKISIGFATGGVDFGTKKLIPNQSFGGGGGTGVSVTPIGFLVVDAEGNVDMLNINNPANDLGSSIESIMEKIPSILDKLQGALASKKEPAAEEKKAEEQKPEEDPDAKAEEVLGKILSETAKTAE